MKKVMMALGMASLLAAGIANASDSGKVTNSHVNFEGRITASTCTVVASSQDKLVKLGEAESNTMLNGISNPVDFTIDLENCPYNGDVVNGERQTAVKVFLNPGADDRVNNNVLKNKAQGIDAASGVGVRVLNENGEILNLGAASPADQKITAKNLKSLSDGNVAVPGFASFALKAQMIGLADGIEPGKVKATTPFTIVYE